MKNTKKECPLCGNDLIYVKNKEAEELKYIAMICNCCKEKFLTAKSNLRENRKMKIVRKDGLTSSEGEVMDLIVAAWNKYIKLEQTQKDDLNEFAEGINQCQKLLALRIARREYPEGWPIKE